MKYRSGFVSNSSSSSFIVGIASIRNIPLFNCWLKKLNLQEWETIVGNFSDIGEAASWKARIKDGKILSDAQTNETKTVEMLVEDFYRHFFIYNMGNDEGDNVFWNKVTEEFEYDISVDYFSGDQKCVLDEFIKASKGESDIFDKVTYDYGAGRHG